MTRKDYELIAEACWLARQTSLPEGEEAVSGVTETVRWLEEGLANDNPRFDRGRFLRACGVEG